MKKKEELKLNLVLNLVKFHKDQFKKVVIVDTSKKTRTKHLSEYHEKCINNEVEMWIYDHHDPIEEMDFHVPQKERVLIKPWGSCCGVLVDEIRKYNETNETKIEMSKEEATIIAMGIYDDTGSFRFIIFILIFVFIFTFYLFIFLFIRYEKTNAGDFMAMSYLLSNYELNRLEITNEFLKTSNTSDFQISQLTRDQLEVYEQLKTTLFMLEINDIKIYLAEARGTFFFVF